MLSPYLIPIYQDAAPAQILEAPEWGLILDCKDRQNRIAQRLTEWDRSATCDVHSWNGNTIIGPSAAASAPASVNLTRTINFPSTGFYRIEVRVRKNATSQGTMTFFDGSTQIEESKSLHYKDDHYERVIYGVRKYTAGNHNLKLTLTKSCYVESIYIYPIFRYTAGSVPSEDSTGTLDVSKIEFTMNAMNEFDTMFITAALKNSYWNGLNDTKMVFGFTDSVTLFLGEGKSDLQPFWGGYVGGPLPSEDLSQVQINCISRFLDLYRVPTYHDFAIGLVPKTDDTPQNSYKGFSNVFTLVEYLANTQEYCINPAGIPFDYGMMINFESNTQFDDIDPGNFKKTFDIDFGNPKPSVKITPGTVVGSTECVLWQNADGWDAAIYTMFNMDYYVSGAGVKYPLQFDLQFTMYQAGQTANDAINYIVRFTGTGARSNIIGSFKQNTLHSWPSLNFNLKALFDKFCYSTSYIVTKVSLVGSITSSMVAHPLCSAIWLDQIYSYSDAQQAPSYVSSGVNYPFDEIQDLCNATSHIVYVVPGAERRDDVLVVKPLAIAITDEVLTQGQYGNVLEITNWNYDPVGNGLCNQAKRGFNKALTGGKTTPSSSYSEDWNSVIDNGPFQNYEFLDTISTQAGGDQVASQYVAYHSHETPAFTVVINGSTLIQPCHYIVADITSGRIQGLNQIMAITQTLDFKNNIFKASVDLNQPSLRFKSKIRNMKRKLGIKDNQNLNSNYRQNGLNGIARNSPGAFNNY
jgi:hypothetical protein